MKYSELFIPTIKETPSEAEVISHQLMLRAGMIRKLAAGVFTWLPMGWRSVRKVMRIVREEMDRAGAQEMMMPAVQPAEIWIESGRWKEYGKELLRFKDRHGHESCLGPTHEEVMADIARREMHSYRDMPKILYHIQTKFRDEIRPRFGVMRSREFIMKDSYTFDVDEEASAVGYQKMYDAYVIICQRLGFKFTVVRADSGAIGGSFSHEFMVLADTGEDAIVTCPNQSCAYAANEEKAEVKMPEGELPDPSTEIAEVATPGAETVEDVAQLLGVEPHLIAKTMIYLADDQLVAAMVAGDRMVNEAKLKNATGAGLLSMPTLEMVQKTTGASFGSLGPVGLDIPVFVDQELYLLDSMYTGANKDGYHLSGVHIARDVPGAKQVDLRMITKEDPCPDCGGPLGFARGIEMGHVFRLGTKYSKAMGANYLDAEGNSRPIVMGSYGIGITRVVAAAIEQGNDENGIIFPLPIAPVSVMVLPMDLSGEPWEVANRIHDQLWERRVDVVLDDRNQRPGVKFKDSDLLGVPFRVVVGAKGLKQGKVELKHRADGREEMIPVDEAVDYIKKLFDQGGGQFL
jgi:prolyl-tRNA synthetase